VDTNVARVLRRAFHPRGSDRRLWEVAAALVPSRGKTAWTFNQAIMELGALVCTARVARCGECPVRGACRTGMRGKGEGERGKGKGERGRRTMKGECGG
jgi:A/G-specific adenine glycosylase